MMKNIIFILLLAIFTISTVEAQVNPVKIKDTNLIKNKQPIQIPVKNIPTPPQQTKSTPGQTTTSNPSVYSLVSVRVTIQTGNDNKEFPSAVYLTLWTKNHQGADYPRDCLFNLANYKNEMRSNSNTDLGLEKYTNGGEEKLTLDAIQRTGLVLSIGYTPNFFMDAWKIEGVTITLQFKDQYGNFHPTMGTKTLRFSNAIGFLNNEYYYMNCTIDQSINALNAAIEKHG